MCLFLDNDNRKVTDYDDDEDDDEDDEGYSENIIDVGGNIEATVAPADYLPDFKDQTAQEMYHKDVSF